MISDVIHITFFVHSFTSFWGHFHCAQMLQVESWEELRKTANTDPRIPLEARQKLADRKAMIMPLEVKFVEPVDRVVPKVMAPWQRVWMRSKGKLSDDQVLHSLTTTWALARPG
jgi:acyl-CoA thioesterase